MNRVLPAAGLLLAMAGLGIPLQAAAAPSPHDLQAMIDAARPGDEVRVPAGVYAGPVVVDKPVRLIGVGRPVIDGGGDGTVVLITAPRARLEGFAVRDSGVSLDHEDAGVKATAPGAEIVGNRLTDVLFGVYLDGAEGALVSDNDIGAKNLTVARRGDPLHVFRSSKTRVEDNRIVGGRDAVVWFSDDTVVRHNLVKGGRYGMHYMYAHRGVFEENRIEGNSVGVFLMFSHHVRLRNNVLAGNYGPSGYGVGFKDCDGAELEDNRVVGNRVGVFVDGSPFSAGEHIIYRQNVFAYNDVAIEFQPSVQRNVFTRNAFIDNRQQISVGGGGFVSESNTWTEKGTGNHWSDYAGYDADGDGRGDVPYKAEALFADVTDRHPALEFFAETPAARTIDMAARAFPVLRPDPRAVDTAPLVDVPHLPAAPLARRSASRSGLAAVSLGLLLVAGGLVVISGAESRRRTAGVAS